VINGRLRIKFCFIPQVPDGNIGETPAIRNYLECDEPEDVGSIASRISVESALRTPANMVGRFYKPAGPYDRPPPEELGENWARHEVEYIVDIMVLNQDLPNEETRYRVAWKGYAPEEYTWEPVENLDRSFQAMLDFNTRLAKGKSDPRKLVQNFKAEEKLQAAKPTSVCTTDEDPWVELH
ncbi:Chromobox like protein-like protein, partial [Leptotrombidium deliense]